MTDELLVSEEDELAIYRVLKTEYGMRRSVSIKGRDGGIRATFGANIQMTPTDVMKRVQLSAARSFVDDHREVIEALR